MRARFVERTGVRVHFEMSGEGLPVGLLHGGAGDRTMWRHASYVEGLDGYTCVLVDSRGHGHSDGPVGEAAYRLEEYAADVEAVIEALGAARVPDLVGALITTGWLADTGMPEERAGLVELVESSGMEGLILSLELEEGTSLPRGWPNSSSLPTPGCLSPGSRGSATAGGHLTGSGARPGFAPCRGRGGPGGRSAERGCAHAVGEGGHDGGCRTHRSVPREQPLPHALQVLREGFGSRS